MPVVRTFRTYRCRSGKRFVRLYKAWHNMQERVRGTKRTGNGNQVWLGLEIEWTTFEEFREWALAHGYSKLHCSLDRRRSAEGYTRKNCRWVTVHFNSMRALRTDPFEMGGEPMDEPSGECPF